MEIAAVKEMRRRGTITRNRERDREGRGWEETKDRNNYVPKREHIISLHDTEYDNEELTK